MEAVRPTDLDLVASLAPAPHAPDLDTFAATLNGTILRPGDAAFEARRFGHNLTYDAVPTVVVQAADASDVARTIILAAESGLELAIRSGGHSLAGLSTTDGGILLDLSPMKGLLIDPARRLAWAQPGLTTGEITAAAAVHGLTVPFGDTGSVGVGGLTTGGGIGYLVRKHGLAIDHLVAAEVVTADGRLLTVDEQRHPDLFWAIRGGGGNVGVVTRFVFRLVEVGMVVGGGLALPATPEVIAGVVALADAAPEELSLIATVMHLPPAPFVPDERVGELVVFILAVHASDDVEAGQAAFGPFRALAEPVVDLIGPMPYPAIYQFAEAASEPGHDVVRAFFTDAVDLDFASTVLEAMGRATSPMAMVQLRVVGGAMARVANDATAFGHRGAKVMFTIITMFEGEPEPHVAWTVGLYEALADRATGVYVNFVAAEADRIHEAYPAPTFARLAEVKRRYDPTNLFRRNHNVAPA